MENQNLRERVEVLEYLLSQHEAGQSHPATPQRGPPGSHAHPAANVGGAAGPATGSRGGVRSQPMRHAWQGGDVPAARERQQQGNGGGGGGGDAGANVGNGGGSQRQVVARKGSGRSRRNSKGRGSAAGNSAAFPNAFTPAGGSARLRRRPSRRNVAAAEGVDTEFGAGLARPTTAEFARISTTGAVLGSSHRVDAADIALAEQPPGTAWSAPGRGGDDEGHELLDPAQAMAELNELLMIRARLKRKKRDKYQGDR